MSNTATATNETATTEEVPTPLEQCQKMHDKGMGEDEVIGALAEFNKMSIMKAVGIYKKFQKQAGLILSKEDRVAKIAELVAVHVTKGNKRTKPPTPATVNMEAAVVDLVKELDVTAGAAKGHVRRYCKANDVEVPTRAAVSEAQLKTYTPVVVDAVKAGKSKADVVKLLQETFPEKDEEGNAVAGGLDEKGAKRAYSRIAKAEGLTASRSAVDYGPVIAWLKENGNKYATKDGLAKALIDEKSLNLSDSAARGMHRLYTFAKQFSA